MNDIIKLFLAAYPLWPAALVEKFKSLFVCELAKFNAELMPQIITTYNNLQSAITSTQGQNGSASVLNPPGAYSARSDFSFYPQMYFYIDQYGNYGSTYNLPCSYTVYYDKRLFSSVNASLSINNVRTGEYTRATNPNYIPAQTGWPNSRPAVGSEYIMIYFLAPSYQLSVVPTLAGYSGAETVLAMVENGVSVDIDAKLLKEFVTFLTAYKKYSSQIESDKSLQVEKNKQDLEQYKNNLSDKLKARQGSLSDLKTQIIFAAKNETNSAKRDMQNLSLSAQSLALQLQDKLK